MEGVNLQPFGLHPFLPIFSRLHLLTAHGLNLPDPSGPWFQNELENAAQDDDEPLRDRPIDPKPPRVVLPTLDELPPADVERAAEPPLADGRAAALPPEAAKPLVTPLAPGLF